MEITPRLREHIKSLFDLRVRDAWSCSDLGKCLRYQFFKRIQAPWEPPKNVLQMMRSFEMGRRVDQMFKEWLRGAFPDCQTDVKLRNESFDLSGEMDALIEGVPVEVKSTSAYTYAEAKDKPRSQYFWRQLQGYLWLSVSSQLVLILFNVDSKTWHEQVIEKDWNTVASIMSDLKTLNECLDTGEPPSNEYDCDINGRNRCPFASLCRKYID